jgi:hypothetical protein
MITDQGLQQENHPKSHRLVSLSKTMRERKLYFENVLQEILISLHHFYLVQNQWLIESSRTAVF